MSNLRPHFRFESLEIWQLAVELAINLHQLASRLEERRLYRYAEQLRSAGLSLPNNIAEGSGSIHAREFQQYLNISCRSLFEDASMLLVFERMQLLSASQVTPMLRDCDVLSRKVTSFSRTLRS